MALSRFETWARLGRIKTGETMFAQASEFAEEHDWRARLAAAPHGEPWYSSLHGSQFPAGDDRWCPRKLVYGLMGVPEVEPFSRMLRATMIAGQAAEDWNIHNLDLDGRLLSANLKAEHQTGLVAADHWLTGSPDFIVLPPGWNRPHLIETKTKDLQVVQDMRALMRSYDANHSRQSRAYIGMGNKITPILWPEVVICQQTWRLAFVQPNEQGEIDDISYMCRDHGAPLVAGSCLMRLKLEPLRTGSLIYMGRDRLNTTAEYFFEHDEEWFQSGLAKLMLVQQYFKSGKLPPHPFGGKEWSQRPCQFCDLKRETCKPDHKAKVTELADSAGIKWAKQVYGEYDFDRVFQTVIDRWKGRSGYYAKTPERHEGRGLRAVA